LFNLIFIFTKKQPGPGDVSAQVITRHFGKVSLPIGEIGGSDFKGIKVITGNRMLTVTQEGGELTAGSEHATSSASTP
jgi:hypothetical protein